MREFTALHFIAHYKMSVTSQRRL